MLPADPKSLRHALGANGNLSGRRIFSAQRSVALDDLLAESILGTEARELSGRSVLVATKDQLAAVAALLELDGAASRIVLCPPDLDPEHLPCVIQAAGVDAVVSDFLSPTTPGLPWLISCDGELREKGDASGAEQRTEWVLLTSGTTGRPKLVVHTLHSLTGAIMPRERASEQVVWSTFYDIRRYGGLQILLRAMLTGASLVLSSAQESTSEFLARAGACKVTHISGTPSHWRRALMSPAACSITPEYVRLSGEIADQSVLDHLRSVYREARISHAFASTEAGVAFDVKDGVAGLPQNLIDHTPAVEMKIVNGSLRIRSERTAERYLDGQRELKDAEGFVDTRDMLEFREGRYYFVGRRDGIINVGGLKVHPEEVEAVINRHPEVRMSLVRTRKNPLTGALVVADVVLTAHRQSDGGDARRTQQDILRLCRRELPSHKVPVAINLVTALEVADTGKLVRPHA